PLFSLGCSKRPASKATASERPRRTFLRYVEVLSEARTRLEGVFSILLEEFFVDLNRDHSPHRLLVGRQGALLLLEQHILQNPFTGRGTGRGSSWIQTSHEGLDFHDFSRCERHRVADDRSGFIT